VEATSRITIGWMPTSADLEEVRKLLAHYCYTIDSRDADAWANLFTEDGVFHYALGEPIVRREALRHVSDRSGLPVAGRPLRG
jgi:SnoaL-like domain